MPHYLMPNFASILPDYSNAEQDVIKLVREDVGGRRPLRARA